MDNAGREHVARTCDEDEAGMLLLSARSLVEIVDEHASGQQPVDDELHVVVAPHRLAKPAPYRRCRLANARRGRLIVCDDESRAAAVLLLEENDGRHRRIYAADDHCISDVAECRGDCGLRPGFDVQQARQRPEHARRCIAGRDEDRRCILARQAQFEGIESRAQRTPLAVADRLSRPQLLHCRVGCLK